MTLVAILGAGAIGTYLGASLATQGISVGVIARPHAAERIQTQGLRLTRPGAVVAVQPAWVASSLADGLARRPGLVLVATKAYDVPALAAEWPEGGAAVKILAIQNGLRAEDPLVARVGPKSVLTGTVTTAVSVRGPGDVVVERERGLGVSLQLAEAFPDLVQAWRQAGLHVRTYADPAAMKWSKLLTNLIGNATSALLDWRVDAIYRHAGLADLERAMLVECLQVMARRGTPVVDLPGTPVRALALLARLPGWLARPLLYRGVAAGRGDKMPSFHLDVWSGRERTEAPWLHGAVATEAAQLGVPAPINAGLARLVDRAATDDLPRQTFRHDPEALLAALGDPPALTRQR